ncbi:hypothetical protein V8G54_030215 [Vigna mungo]|uniref:3-methyl-2-oxobutanoate hydroxymethyltransferase n=1 Tax=Vigna mungo TaxID=3915 RepID=A0AAQ3MUS6_VIGMU
MLVHWRVVAGGAKTPLLVGDLPFEPMSLIPIKCCSCTCGVCLIVSAMVECFRVLYVVDTAVRILKEGGMDAIKLEGGSPSRIVAAKAIVEAGITVMGHVGLTPQAISVVETALALQEAGCFSVVLECMPLPIATATTTTLQISKYKYC